MKKLKYLFVSVLVGIMGMGMAEAKSNPTFTADLGITKDPNSETLSVEAIIKNSATTCDGVGLKNGKVYIYLDENIVEKPTNIAGIYRDYNEETGKFTEANMLCSYDGANSRVSCAFGRNVNSLSLISYSDCKDELVITFETALCEGSDNCDLKVEVEGEAIDYNDGEPESISGSVKKMGTFDFDCNSKISNKVENEEPNETPTTPDEPTYEPDENPNTYDSGILYILIGSLSLVLMGVTMMLNKKRAY